MKTFRWTVPEVPRSRAEEANSRKLALNRLGIPTKEELNEFHGWEKALKHGYPAWLVRVTVIMAGVVLTLLFLRSQDILISRTSSITPLYIGLGMAMISTFSSWRRYVHNRQKIRKHLKKPTIEPASLGRCESFSRKS